MTVQPTIIGNRIKRTKFFFGYRYMWTRCQLAEPNSYVGAGVRRDVTEPPKWVKKIENPMVEHNIVDEGFLNSVAINVYHDGSEGLAQHFDDAVRFRQVYFPLCSPFIPSGSYPMVVYLLAVSSMAFVMGHSSFLFLEVASVS